MKSTRGEKRKASIRERESVTLKKHKCDKNLNIIVPISTKDFFEYHGIGQFAFIAQDHSFKTAILQSMLGFSTVLKGTARVSKINYQFQLEFGEWSNELTAPVSKNPKMYKFVYI